MLGPHKPHATVHARRARVQCGCRTAQHAEHVMEHARPLTVHRAFWRTEAGYAGALMCRHSLLSARTDSSNSALAFPLRGGFWALRAMLFQRMLGRRVTKHVVSGDARQASFGCSCLSETLRDQSAPRRCTQLDGLEGMR
jgi:hypothetical protein